MEDYNLFKKLGLTEYESRVYATLAKLGPSKVREIVASSNVPRNKVYDSLQSLELKRKVMSLPVSPKKYSISDASSWNQDINELSLSMNQFLKQIQRSKSSSEHKDIFWVVKSQKSIQEKLSIQSTQTKKEILSCNNLSKILYKNVQTLESAVKIGVAVKMLCTYNPEKIESYKSWLSTGAKIRIFDTKKFGPLLPRITIFDGKISRLTIGRPEVQNSEEYISIWTESHTFSQMLRNHFLTMWKNAKPLEKYLKNNFTNLK